MSVATKKYEKANYDKFQISMKKGYKSKLFEHCSHTGESLNAFILRAIAQTIEQDEQTPGFLHKPDTSDSD